jgi:cardiolipin synthase
MLRGLLPKITLHSLIIVISVLTYILTTRAERERRPPSIAIAWVLGMLALPYVVLPMYLFFGRRKLPRKVTQRSAAHPQSRHWAEDLIESFGLGPSSLAQVRFHRDGIESHASLVALLEGAAQRVDICTYLVGKDPVGRDLMDRLVACVQRGVRVRFLLDGVGAIQLPHSWIRHLKDSGVEIAVFSPLLARKTQGPRNLRNHRKWAIADGEKLWAGGRNLAAEYFTGKDGAPAWGDLSYELSGPTAGAVALQFAADWDAAGGATAPVISPGVPPPSGTRTQFLPSGPDQSEDTVHSLLIDACFQSTERLLAVTPYFVPDAPLETAIRLAARRGVKIDLCIPAKSNHLLADFVRNRSLRALSRAGVSVHLLPAMNHAKAVVFDDAIALCGSCNLDSRSLLLNYESHVVFYDAVDIEWLAGWIQDLIPSTTAFDARAPGLFRDICEGLLLTVAFQL